MSAAVTTGRKLARLLYVDDEVDILNVVKVSKNHGFSVDVATSAEQALAMDLRSYDMIVIDIRMPRMDGFQFYDAIKSKVDDAAKTKVCFFTAFTSYPEEYQRRFPTWNGCCFITKPMSVRLLAEKLRELLDS